ncbi:MAG: lysophospholipid acyltransferase family protein [Thermodesulfobacteriota bacterium]
MATLPLTDHCYRTAPDASTWLGRTLPSFTYYLTLVRCVFQGAFLAKKGRYDLKQWCAGSHAMLTALERTGAQVEVSGLEHLENLPGPAVIVGNHMSMLETVILPIIICPIRQMTYVLKEDLLNYPIFKHILTAVKVIAVTRTNPRQDLKIVMGEGLNRLEKGCSVLVFPQTTRSTTFDPSQMSSIGVKLAKKGKVSLVPLALKTDALQNGKMIKDLGRIDPRKSVHFAFGEPLEVEGKGTAEHEVITDFIAEKLAAWGN